MPSTSTSSTAAASTGRPARTNCSTARTITRSIISLAAGMPPAAMMSRTAAPAEVTEGKSTRIVRTAGGLRVSRTHTFVTTPRVPSPPTMNPRRSYPGGSGAAPPTVSTSPSGSTISTPRMCCEVTPDARQWGPPALVATLPPMLQAAWLEGSGA